MDQRLRLSDPGEIAAALPALIGFPPHESLVLVALRREDDRITLTARVDLPPRRSAEVVAGELARRVAGCDPARVLVAVVSEAADVGALVPGRRPGADPMDLPHRGLVEGVEGALAARDVPVLAPLLVRGGRWWSYTCPAPCCAPGAGTPLPSGPSPVAVAAIAAGAVVEPDRAALRRRIDPPAGPAAEASAAAIWRAGLEGGHAEAAWGRPEEAVERALAYCRPRSTTRLTDGEVAAVVWALIDPAVRDRALGLALGAEAAAAETLWTECTRRAPPPLDAAPATLLAVSAWLRGDGAMANVALERARDSAPGYRLAVLLDRALAEGVPPEELRALITDVVGNAGGAAPPP